MAGTGNLWYWLPQARFEQKLRLSSATGVNAQIAAVQVGAFLPRALDSFVSPYAGGPRLALQARLALWHKSGDNEKFQIAPGFQVTSNHVAGSAIVTKIASLDWSYNLHPKLEWKGLGYYGQNVASLGTFGNGFYLTPTGTARPVRSAGGWTQLSSPLTNRITLNGMAGLENDKTGEVYGPGLAHSFSFAGNAVFHLSPNVLLSVEAQRLWTRTFLGQSEAYNHYDLALAYLF
jgi:hypothetical protein